MFVLLLSLCVCISMQGLVESTVYRWDFGDGTTVSGVGQGVQNHTYMEEGTYTVRVVATNEGGSSTIFTPVLIGGEGSLPQ